MAPVITMRAILEMLDNIIHYMYIILFVNIYYHVNIIL